MREAAKTNALSTWELAEECQFRFTAGRGFENWLDGAWTHTLERSDCRPSNRLRRPDENCTAWTGRGGHFLLRV